MTDLEISKALALAIGWPRTSIAIHGDMWEVMVLVEPNPFGWRVFDYEDWNVIAPIAAKYDMFPHKSDTQGWWFPHKHTTVFADTPQKAIALAVIQGARHDQN